jgi:hypothetical protein
MILHRLATSRQEYGLPVLLNNPTATPAINSSINCTMYIDNNNRATIGGLNIVTLFANLVLDGPIPVV